MRIGDGLLGSPFAWSRQRLTRRERRLPDLTLRRPKTIPAVGRDAELWLGVVENVACGSGLDGANVLPVVGRRTVEQERSRLEHIVAAWLAPDDGELKIAGGDAPYLQ